MKQPRGLRETAGLPQADLERPGHVQDKSAATGKASFPARTTGRWQVEVGRGYDATSPCGAPAMLMSKADFELRHTSIHEQYETRRCDNGSTADGANAWRIDELTKLYEESGWTLEEIGAWFAAHIAKRVASK
jgi:hypothetical protein